MDEDEDKLLEIDTGLPVVARPNFRGILGEVGDDG